MSGADDPREPRPDHAREEGPGRARECDRTPDAADRGLGRHLSVFFSESTLWPVTAVAALIAATFVASLIAFAWQDRNLAAQGALVILAALSIFTMEPELRQRRLGAATVSVLVLWTLSVLGSVALIAATTAK
jgi:hypothetical protein